MSNTPKTPAGKKKSANAQFCERGNYNGKGKAGAARSSLHRYH